MKTNNLSKRSFLTSLILMMSAGFNAMKGSKSVSSKGSANGYIGGGSPFFIPQKKKLKGYQKKSQLSTFNKNR